jgi:WXG100 family type VII secretion target
MAADIVSYDESVAGSAHGDIGTVAQGVQSSLDDLTGFVNRVRSNWEGDEMDIYDGIQRRWDTAATTVSDILRSVQSALGETTSSVQEMRGGVRGILQG